MAKSKQMYHCILLFQSDALVLEEPTLKSLEEKLKPLLAKEPTEVIIIKGERAVSIPPKKTLDFELGGDKISIPLELL